MSKSVGNIIDPVQIMTKYGADNIRWYMLYASPVWTPLKFSEAGVKEVHSKFFNPFKNTYTFFQTYANIDNIDIEKCNVPYEEREEIDKWLLSKFNKLVKNVTTYYDQFDLNLVVKEITSFVSDDLSNWYIRRNRNRFWSSELDNSKKSVYRTTYEVLVGLCKICAPIIPYTTEEIYTNLTNEESVHLADYPTCDESLINEKVEEKMDLIRDLISLGRNAREESKIKVRQPISEVIIDGKNKNLIADLTSLIEEELNVKTVTFTTDLNNYMNFIVKPNFKVVGKVLGSKIKEFTEVLSKLTLEEVNSLNNGQNITVSISGEDFEVTKEMVDIRYSSKEGFDVATENNNFIILNTTLTTELIEEGIARELVSKVQNLRKEKDFNIVDRICLYYKTDDEAKEAIQHFEEFIKNETLSLELIEKENLSYQIDLNGHEATIDVEQVKNI